MRFTRCRSFGLCQIAQKAPRCRIRKTLNKKNEFSAILVDLKFFLDTYDVLSYIYFMKVTALIPDDLVKDVKQYAGGKNITESLITALEEWLSLKKIQYLNEDIVKKPLEFSKDFSANKNREMNRRR